MVNKQFINEYWSRTEFKQKLAQHPQITTSDLLFLMPNNVKRMHGIPVTRVAKRGRKSRQYKRLRKKKIWQIPTFDILEEMVEQACKYAWQKDFFEKFCDIHDI